MNCIKCGARLHKDARFCHKCGKAVPVDEYFVDEEEYEVEDSKGKRVMLVLLVTLILLVLLGLTAVFSYLFVGNQSSLIKESYSTEPPAVASTVVPETATETDAPTKKPSATKKPSDSDEKYIHVGNPVYKTYTDSEYRFSCAYPTHFEKFVDNASPSRYALRANGGEITMKICAEKNDAQTTLQQSLSAFKSKHGGEVEYSSIGETYYAVRINDDGFCYYKYLRSKNNNFYWFEFTYPEDERDTYEGYIQHIYESFTIK